MTYSKETDPAYMEWEVLQKTLYERLRDDDREDDELVATRGEILAVLAFASLFDRQAQPRRDEEEKTYQLIRKAAELIETQDRSRSSMAEQGVVDSQAVGSVPTVTASSLRTDYSSLGDTIV